MVSTTSSATSAAAIVANALQTTTQTNKAVLLFDWQHILINLSLAFILALMIALVYKATHKGLSYSQTFVMTLILSGLVICAVMMVIGTNIARAFGAFGAFSLIRFRTAIKDAKDMGYMFLVLAVGMAVGTENYAMAVMTTAFTLLVMLALTKVNFGSVKRFDYILSFYFDTRLTHENAYKQVFDKFLKRSDVLYIKAREQGHVLLLSFSVKFMTEKDSSNFVSELQRTPGLTEVNLIAAKNDVEY